jgi:hypothetical protein
MVEKKTRGKALILITIHVMYNQPAISALCAYLNTYGTAVNNLKSLWIRKCTFGVDGLK